MKTVAALALLLLAALAVPTASAQDVSGVSVEAGVLGAPIPYQGSASLPLNVTVGCAEILTAMSENEGTAPLTITVTSPPAWLTVGDASADLASQASATSCLSGGGQTVHQAMLPLTVGMDAPGVVDHTIQVVATVGSTASDPADAVFTVAYFVNYTLVPDVAFPVTVNGTETSFNVTVTQASNARSMVMIEGLKTSAGVFSGLGSQVYENDAGKPDSRTFKVTFKAPSGEWSNATAQFTAYGHYLLLDGRANDFDNGTPVTYAFKAGEPAHEHEEEENDAPAPVGLSIALGLVALAAFVRRRA